MSTGRPFPYYSFNFMLPRNTLLCSHTKRRGYIWLTRIAAVYVSLTILISVTMSKEYLKYNSREETNTTYMKSDTVRTECT